MKRKCTNCKCTNCNKKNGTPLHSYQCLINGVLLYRCFSLKDVMHARSMRNFLLSISSDPNNKMYKRYSKMLYRYR